MAISRAGKTDTRIVNIEPGMYIVRFDGNPTLGESAILSIAPGDPITTVDLFASEHVKHATLASADDCIVVRCGGGSGNLVITSISLTSGTLTGARVDRIAAAGDRTQLAPSLGGHSVTIPAPQPKEAIQLGGHIQWQGDVEVAANAWLGDPRGHDRLEGFSVEWANKPADVDLAYSCTIGGMGRSPAVLSGGFCGSRQRAAPIQAVTVSLVGKNSAAYELAVQAAFDNSPLQTLASGVEGRGVSGQEQLTALQVIVTRKV